MKTPTNPVKVIRAYCLGCCLSNSFEVASCPASECELWPWRFGKNPYRAKREMTPEESARKRAIIQKVNFAKKARLADVH